MSPSLSRRLVIQALAFCLLLSQAFATWSIVVVNRRTGEICVASATCIENFNLRTALSIMGQEAGGGAAQAFVSPLSTRTLINDLLLQGVPPDEILDAIEAVDGIFQWRQFGIVDLEGRAATFTGSNTSSYASGVTGEIGDLVYAIQGNILTGSPVISDAENALRNTPGDLSQRVMAAMEAARDMGGDGRCSCDPVLPESCGTPPPSPFKSAHVGFLIIARPGDEPYCSSFACGLGDLYFVINKIALFESDPDVVDEMRIKFDQIRLDLDDRPDAILSETFAFEEQVPAGSPNPVSYVLSLADVDGDLITHGGSTVSMVHDPRSAGLASLIQFTDHQDGTYTVEVQPGAEPGLDLLRFVVDDGIRPVTLWPPTALLHTASAPAPLLAPTDVPGLQGLTDLHAVFPQPDGLACWIRGDRGFGQELLFAERPDLLSPFTVTTDVGVNNFDVRALQDLWVSADGLRATFAALDGPGGISRLYSTTRMTTAEDFDEPALLVDLDSGLEEGGPWLSGNELEIWFHSARDGQFDLWHATRLSPEARWFPPEKVVELSTSGEERAPMLDQGDTRILFTGSGLHQSFRAPDGSFHPATPLPGVFQSPAAGLQVIGSTPSSSSPDAETWRLDDIGPGTRVLSIAGTSHGSLSVSPASISVASGGTFDFQVDAGIDLALADYLLLAGDPLDGTPFPSVGILPIQAQDFTRGLVGLYALPELAEGRGQLDATGSASPSLQITAGAPIPAILLDRDLGFTCVATSGSSTFLANRVVLRLLP
ncbi:MAG: DUF1028 domain-containing protein [Planctomycetota bacterium]|jgi:hypothetical protein